MRYDNKEDRRMEIRQINIQQNDNFKEVSGLTVALQMRDVIFIFNHEGFQTEQTLSHIFIPWVSSQYTLLVVMATK